MDEISRECFPDSDDRLQEAGDRLTGLALVDEDKGVVGYCLYNEKERYISDMAVLPEYRKDKNASSKRLLTEIKSLFVFRIFHQKLFRKYPCRQKRFPFHPDQHQ